MIKHLSSDSTDSVKLYPNPGNDKIDILVPFEKTHDKYSLTFYDSSGKFISEQGLTELNNGINTKQLTAGQYQYIISRDKKKFAKGSFTIIH